ncbi:MAG TPA: hypothetical protein VK421_12585 [Pyrinomonadaceae bacterium]|nr:hypothetical protein [Pyrinomonadaceae bacterium]
MKAIFLAAVLMLTAAPAGYVGAATPAAQCKRADRVINKVIRFERGRTTAVVKDRVLLCTAHSYRLRAKAGQTMSVNLATGNRTSLTLHAPSGDALADGEKSWSGELPETGDYHIHIGTDATAGYTLEVTIR